MTEKECKEAIQKIAEWDQLVDWWKKRKAGEFPTGWAPGKFFEYAILRAFELEKAEVVYPYGVPYPNSIIEGETIVEQIDGVIYHDNLIVLTESKDYTDQKIDIEPLAKLEVRLRRRPAPVIGCIFSASDYTWPAMALIESLMPQTILLWSNNDITYCFEHHCFTKGLKLKYRAVVEKCNHLFDLSTYAQINPDAL